MHFFHEPRPELASARQALRELLNGLARGSIGLRSINSRASVHVEYMTANGWKLRVFNDCGCWDYLESAEDPSGQLLDYDEVQAVRGVEWALISDLPIWGQFLNYGEFDPEYPDHESGA